MNALERLVVVLVRTEGPLNLGSVARLCGNFGCSLRLVNPLTDAGLRDAIKMAHPSEELLRLAPVFSDLGAALSDVSLAIATSSKMADAIAGPPLNVNRAGLLLPAAQEKVALVFGNERDGLSVEEGAHCPRVIRLPTPGPTESFNLSHSVAVTLTLFAAAAAEKAQTPEAQFRAAGASRASLQHLLSTELERHGFFKGKTAAKTGFQPRLQELIDKMDLSERDVELMHDLIRALAQ